MKSSGPGRQVLRELAGSLQLSDLIAATSEPRIDPRPGFSSAARYTLSSEGRYLSFAELIVLLTLMPAVPVFLQYYREISRLDSHWALHYFNRASEVMRRGGTRDSHLE